MRKCPECGGERETTTITYDIECLSDGQLWNVHVPSLTVIKCLCCEEIFFTNTSDDEISAALLAKKSCPYCRYKEPDGYCRCI